MLRRRFFTWFVVATGLAVAVEWSGREGWAQVLEEEPTLTPKQFIKRPVDKGRRVDGLTTNCQAGGVLSISFLQPSTSPPPPRPDPPRPVTVSPFGAEPDSGGKPARGNANVTTTTTTVKRSQGDAQVTTTVEAPKGVNVSVTVNVEINRVKNVGLKELDLPYSQPWAFTPRTPVSDYIPAYLPCWPPARPGLVVLPNGYVWPAGPPGVYTMPQPGSVRP